MKCENENTPNVEYCPSCLTRHESIEDSNECCQKQLKELKGELQKAINERNAAWFQLEDLNISIKEIPECECENLGSECPACEIDDN